MVFGTPSIQESTLESPFFLLHGRDPRLPYVLDVESPQSREGVCLDTYKEELVSGLVGAWDLARKNMKKAQQAQMRCYNRKAKGTGFRKEKGVYLHAH